MSTEANNEINQFKNPLKARAGRLGGLVTLGRYGIDELRRRGRLGGRPGSQTYDDIVRQRQPLVEVNSNNKEVKTGSRGNLTEYKRLYRLRHRSNGEPEIEPAGTTKENPIEVAPARKGTR